MKANELRIGNWVHHNENWCYREKKDFNFQWEDRDWYATGESTLFLENVSAIPITPEILVKAGFEYSDNGMEIWMHRWGYNICRYYDKFAFRVYKAVNVNPIKGVHHLQNLYFSLTYTELKIEL